MATDLHVACARSRPGWVELCEALDSGRATRALDDARLRRAAASAAASFATADVASPPPPPGAWDAYVPPSALALSRLLERGHFSSVDAADEYGRSPLFLAAAGGAFHAARLLLQARADPSLAESGGCLPSVAAQRAGHSDVATLLLMNGMFQQRMMLHPPGEHWEPRRLQRLQHLTREHHKQLRKPLIPMLLLLSGEGRGGGGGGGGISCGGGSDGGGGGGGGGGICAEWALSPALRTPADGGGLHPGAGTLVVDGAVSLQAVAALKWLWSELPVAPKTKESCIDRSYYCDPGGEVRQLVGEAVRSGFGRAAAASAAAAAAASTAAANRGGGGDGSGGGVGGCRPADEEEEEAAKTAVAAAAAAATVVDAVVSPLMRYLCYSSVGGDLPPHVDLPRAVDYCCEASSTSGADGDGSSSTTTTAATTTNSSSSSSCSSDGSSGGSSASGPKATAATKTTHSFLLCVLVMLHC
jgi:hypothetical protein